MKRAVPPEKSSGRLSICKILADWKKLWSVYKRFSSSHYLSVKRATNTTVCMIHPFIFFPIYCLPPSSHREASRKRGKGGRRLRWMGMFTCAMQLPALRASRVLSLSFSFFLFMSFPFPPLPPTLYTLKFSISNRKENIVQILIL